MTNKPMLSVERELLATAMKADASMGASAIELVNGWAAMEELRALLDNQADCRCKRYGKDNPHWPCPVHAEPGAQHQSVPPLIATLHENGELIATQATIAQQAKLIELLKGKGQGQGEPVLFVCPDDLTNENFIGISGKFKRDTVHVQPLYAEQLAPVAVVMPEHTMRSVMDAIQKARGFPVLTSNQCHALAESLNYVARLNGVEP